MIPPQFSHEIRFFHLALGPQVALSFFGGCLVGALAASVQNHAELGRFMAPAYDLIKKDCAQVGFRWLDPQMMIRSISYFIMNVIFC